MINGGTENTLDLSGDLDDVELLEAIESACGVKYSIEEAERLRTVGDAYDTLVEKLKAYDERRKVCFAAICFYRLRRALREITGHADIRPSTQFDELFAVRRVNPVLKRIEQRTGMALPAYDMNFFAAALGAILGVGSFIAALILADFVGWWALLALLGWPAAYLIFRFARTYLPPRYADVGDLARAMAGLNLGSLMDEFGVRHKDDIWNALVVAIRNYTAYDGAINHETTFFSSVK